MYLTQVSPADARPSHSGGGREGLMDVGGLRDAYGGKPEAESVWVMRLKIASPKQSTAASRLAVSLDYMMTHLNQPLKISTLSTMAGLSASRFFELFKSATGDTPLNWFIRARMQWAAELLERSSLPIKQIAGQVGYEDQFYFSRLFKAVHGMSPSEYRLQKMTIPGSMQ